MTDFNTNLQDPNAGIAEKTLPFITAAWNMAAQVIDETGQLNMMGVLVNRGQHLV